MNTKFFTKNGKKLRSFVYDKASSYTTSIVPEAVSSLVAEEITTLSTTSKENFAKYIKTKLPLFTRNIKTVVKNALSAKTAYTWATASIILVFSIGILTLLNPFKIKPDISDKYVIFSSKPLTFEQSTHHIYTKDSRAQKINGVFKYFKCPLESMGEKFVEEADRNNIPWYIVASIAFKESSCGKNTPKVDGEESYNAWGWAVYGSTTKTFDNWARGIETVSKYLGTRFYSQGITEECEIMKVYTPPSNGSWCEDVKYFGNLIQDFATP